MLELPRTRTVWIPEVTYLERMGKRIRWDRDSTIVLVASGNIGLTAQLVLRAVCAIAVRYYPFDKQQCTFSFASWLYSSFMLNLTLNSRGISHINTLSFTAQWSTQG